MLFLKKSLHGTLYSATRLQQMPVIAVKAVNYNILERPAHFRQRMLELIAQAKNRIMMTVLYLQDDEAGKEILEALYKAQERNPKLHICIYVDFHRAQRGLIGQEQSLGNSALYYKMAENSPHPPAIYGVPVKRREIFGVMHLKGCVFDDTVLYSGASINDVYLDKNGRYRLDRYHEIQSQELADTLCSYTTSAFHINFAVQDFSQGKVKSAKEISEEIRQLQHHLTKTQYTFKNNRLHNDEVGITPLVGLGKKGNILNKTVLWLLSSAKNNLFICTPYFNPPKILQQALEAALMRGVKITLVVGDKVANDFYLKPEEKFSPIGAVPYIYEQNLRAFIIKFQNLIEKGQLKVMLWKNGSNTYHLKGIFADRSLALITGNNLNPRAWSLDLENGLLVHDPHHLMQEKFGHEQQYILKHTTQIMSEKDLDDFSQYPEQVRKLLTKVKRFKASIFIKQLL